MLNYFPLALKWINLVYITDISLGIKFSQTKMAKHTKVLCKL